MATVYLARSEHQSGFEKIVALKVIHDHLVEEKAFVDMFLDEARLAACIDHPNVCTVFDFGQERGVHYLAMEFLLGEPLKRVLRTIARRKDPEEIKRLPWYSARLIAEACEGLHAAHELCSPKGDPLGVVHRDVSPENIVVTYDGGVKIVDFGVAKAAERIHETKVAKLKGKYAYVSPEQIRDEGVDRRSDVWGLGVCLWEALTLRRLFRRESDAGTLSAVLFDDIPPPSSVSSWVPESLDHVVLKALSRDRNHRYRTARALGQDLRKFLTTTGMTLGTAELSEWMELLFPGEREARMLMLQQAREGQPSEAFPEVPDEETSASDSTLPSVSRLVSAGAASSLRAGISLQELSELARTHGVSIPASVAGIIAMDVCDGLRERPAVVDADQVRLTEQGRVSLAPPLDAARAADAARSIVSAFEELPMQEGAVTEMLRSAEFRSPDELNDALQRAIDPMTRGNARQELVALVRLRYGPETLRPARAEPTYKVPLEPGPDSAAARESTDSIVIANDFSALDLPDPDELAGRMRGHGLRNAILFLVLVAAAGTVFAWSKPDLVRGWLGLPPTNPAPVAEPIVHEIVLGQATIHLSTEGARVLMFVGRAPVDVRDVARGVPQLLLATQSGRADAWATVPADAVWTGTEDPRLELAMELPEAGEAVETPAPAAAALTEDTGTVRVVTNPPSAKIFRVVGMAPEVQISGVRTDQVLELLIMREGFVTARRLITPGQWGDPARPRSELDVTLVESPHAAASHRRSR